MVGGPQLTEMRRRLQARKGFIKKRRVLQVLTLLSLITVQNAMNIIFTLGCAAGVLRYSQLLRKKAYDKPTGFRDIFPGFKRISLDDFSSAQYLDLFRFRKKHVKKHLNYLRRFRGFPETVRYHYNTNRPGDFYKFTLEELYLMTLYSLSRPYRVLDIAITFGRTPAEVSVGLSFFGTQLFEIAKEYLQDVDPDNCWFDYTEARKSSDAIRAKGIPLPRTTVYCDGTHRRCCNPSNPEEQTMCYNRYIRGTSLKFVNCSTAQGVTLLCLGPFVGKNHDSNCAEQGDMYDKLYSLLNFPAHNWCGVAYGDCAFPTRFPVVASYNPATNDHQRRFNKKMSKGRISVEWSFCGPVNTFPGIDFKKRNKVGHGFARYYLIAVWLFNLKTIHYGSLTSKYFKCKPPSLEKYLGVPDNSLD